MFWAVPWPVANQLAPRVQIKLRSAVTCHLLLPCPCGASPAFRGACSASRAADTHIKLAYHELTSPLSCLHLQMNLNMDNCWGIISALVNLCMDSCEADGELAGSPSAALLVLYPVVSFLPKFGPGVWPGRVY